MKLNFSPYLEQRVTWPEAGKHILAQYDEDTLVVYQAYNRTIAEFAALHGYFGAGFSFGRMSWIKPNFLWMMYRCGWCTKDANQERVLAIWLRRPFFDELLTRAVASSHGGSHLSKEESWSSDHTL